MSICYIYKTKKVNGILLFPLTYSVEQLYNNSITETLNYQIFCRGEYNEQNSL